MGLFEAFLLITASFLISAAMMPKAKAPEAAGISDFDFPQSDEGSPQAVIFGECWTGDWMVLDVGNYRTTPIKRRGGKK